MNVMNSTAITDIGRLCNDVREISLPRTRERATHKWAKVERPGLEVIITQPTRNNRDNVGNIESIHGYREDRIDRLRACERQKAQQSRRDDDKPDGIDRSAGILVHSRENAREREHTVSRKCEGLPGCCDNLLGIIIKNRSEYNIPTKLKPIMYLGSKSVQCQQSGGRE